MVYDKGEVGQIWEAALRERENESKMGTNRNGWGCEGFK